MLRRIKEKISRGFFTMASSPCTPTPPSMASRMAGARLPDKSIDIEAVIKQQEMARDLPLPSLSAGQISACKNALKLLKQKSKSSSGRGVIDREFDTLQVFIC